jgi:hypothetical protein
VPGAQVGNRRPRTQNLNCAATVPPLCRHCATLLSCLLRYPPSNHKFPLGIWHVACRQHPSSHAAACEAQCGVGGRGPGPGAYTRSLLCST